MKPGDNFRHRLRAEREAQGLTQRELAQLVGLNDVKLCKIEIGERRVILDEALALAAALNVELAELIAPLT